MRATIAVLNLKGGATKTTTSATVSAALHELGHGPVLMVDCDEGASLTATFGVQLKPGELTLYEALFAQEVRLEQATRTIRPGLDLVPVGKTFAAAQHLMVSQPAGQTLLRDALKGVADRYQYVVLDCPPDLVQMNVACLLAATGVLVPVTADFLCLQRTIQTLQTIETVREKLYPALRIYGLVVTRHVAGTTHSREVEERIRGAYPHLVFRDVVPESVRMKEAPLGASSGIFTILDYDTHHKAAESYRGVVHELIERITHEETAKVERATIA